MVDATKPPHSGHVLAVIALNIRLNLYTKVVNILNIIAVKTINNQKIWKNRLVLLSLHLANTKNQYNYGKSKSFKEGD